MGCGPLKQWVSSKGIVTLHAFQIPIRQYSKQWGSVFKMWTNLYLGVGDTEHALYEAIMLCGLENRDIELPILLHPLSVTSGPVRVTHLLWSSEGLLYRKVHFYFLFAITSQMLMTLWGKPEQAAWNECVCTTLVCRLDVLPVISWVTILLHNLCM